MGVSGNTYGLASGSNQMRGCHLVLDAQLLQGHLQLYMHQQNVDSG